MEIADYGLDLNFRPRSYFWPIDLERHLLATIKGKKRREFVEAAIAAGQLDLLPGKLLKPGLSSKDRQAIGRIHPMFMGGEYLPELEECEVEIARIEIKSTTYDVTSVRACLDGDRIAYRVVDEYDGDTLTGRNARTSDRPLTQGELVEFFDGAWSILDVLDYNYGEDGYDEDEMLAFVRPSSEFYPEFGRLCYERIKDWGQAKRKALGIEVDEDEEESE